jgi:hypothetical protein
MLGCYPGTFGFRGVSGGAGTARVAVLHHQMVKQAATPSMQSRQCRCGPVSANQPHRSAVPNNLTMPEAMVANEAARIGRRDRTSSSFFKESRQQKLTLLSARGRVFSVSRCPTSAGDGKAQNEFAVGPGGDGEVVMAPEGKYLISHEVRSTVA